MPKRTIRADLVIAGTLDVDDGATIAGNLAHTGTKVGFNGTAAIAKPAVSGARNNPEAALANLLTALANLGLITNSTTAS